MTEQSQNDAAAETCSKCGSCCCCCCCCDIDSDEAAQFLRGMADVIEDVFVEEE